MNVTGMKRSVGRGSNKITTPLTRDVMDNEA